MSSPRAKKWFRCPKAWVLAHRTVFSCWAGSWLHPLKQSAGPSIKSIWHQMNHPCPGITWVCIGTNCVISKQHNGQCRLFSSEKTVRIKEAGRGRYKKSQISHIILKVHYKLGQSFKDLFSIAFCPQSKNSFWSLHISSIRCTYDTLRTVLSLLPLHLCSFKLCIDENGLLLSSGAFTLWNLEFSFSCRNREEGCAPLLPSVFPC